jgi:hypothetical protein
MLRIALRMRSVGFGAIPKLYLESYPPFGAID